MNSFLRSFKAAFLVPQEQTEGADWCLTTTQRASLNTARSRTSRLQRRVYGRDQGETLDRHQHVERLENHVCI
jgi:hypothetical protein